MPQDLTTPPTPPRRRKHKNRRGLLLPVCCAALLFLIVIFQPWNWGRSDNGESEPDPDGVTEEPEPQVTPEIPDWVTVNLLPVNEYSRPGLPLERVNGVVVHYVGNPNTTAEQNRSYFESLAETGETSASSNFIIGMDGEVIMCVPIDEVAYCSGERNFDTISIECCHPDDTGEFTDETMDSLTRLLKWLIESYGLQEQDIIRHYDVSGKECPRYFVQHPEEWEEFRHSLFE